MCTVTVAAVIDNTVTQL